MSCGPWGQEESDTTEQLKWAELNWYHYYKNSKLEWKICVNDEFWLYYSQMWYWLSHLLSPVLTGYDKMAPLELLKFFFFFFHLWNYMLVYNSGMSWKEITALIKEMVLDGVEWVFLTPTSNSPVWLAHNEDCPQRPTVCYQRLN